MSSTTPTSQIERKKKHLEWRLAHRGTHTELTHHDLRLILANELLVLRAVANRSKAEGDPFSKDMLADIKMGLVTFARRVEDVRKNGIEKVYAQNYPKKENKSET